MLASLSFSDLILASSGEIYLKGTPEMDQQLVPVSQTDSLREEISQLVKVVEKSFPRSSALDFRIRHEGVTYRAASCSDIEGRSFFLRRLAETVPDLSDLLLPSGLDTWLMHPDQSKGLILFCGSQGSGKTTSAGAFIAARLRKHGGHGVTFENPVEMPLSGAHGEHGRCFQTEIRDEAELARHIERAHRYGMPNIIGIGEIRSKYAASESLCVSLGSSRQLVVATLHGLDIVTALDRLMGWAREQDGDVAAQNLSHSLLAIIYQELETSEEFGKRLRVPQFLLVPFSETAKGIRAKLRENRLTGLEDDIREQRNRLRLQGIEAFGKGTS